MKTEKYTRKEISEHNLQAAGWNVAARSQVFEEFEIAVGLPEGVSNRKARFIQFIRHILGIENLKSFPLTVAEAFAQFIRQHTNLSSRQLDFLTLLKNFIVEREKVERRDLINTPFTVIHPQGIRGVFSPTEINEILTLTEKLAA